MASIKLEFISAALGRSATVNVLLPSDHMAGSFEPPYKTLYLLPGYSASATQLLTYLGLRKQCELKGVAIVLPDGENLFYQDMPNRNTFYSTYVGKELVEVTRKLLPLSDKREDTFIGGISMGGYGALYNGMKYRDTFSKVVAFSPVVDAFELLTCGAPGFSLQQFNGIFGSKEEYYEGDTNLTKVWCEAKREELPELFLCCGTCDRAVYAAFDPFEKELCKHNIPHICIGGDADHELHYWEDMLDPAFSFLAGMKVGSRNKLLIPDRM